MKLVEEYSPKKKKWYLKGWEILILLYIIGIVAGAFFANKKSQTKAQNVPSKNDAFVEKLFAADRWAPQAAKKSLARQPVPWSRKKPK